MNTDSTGTQDGAPQRRGLVLMSSCASTAYYDETAIDRLLARKQAEAAAAAANTSDN